MSENLIERLRKDADDWTQFGTASNVKWEPTAQIEREAADALTFAANRIAELEAERNVASEAHRLEVIHAASAEQRLAALRVAAQQITNNRYSVDNGRLLVPTPYVVALAAALAASEPKEAVTE